MTIEEEQAKCPHDDLDGWICLACGKDIREILLKQDPPRGQKE